MEAALQMIRREALHFSSATESNYDFSVVFLRFSVCFSGEFYGFGVFYIFRDVFMVFGVVFTV